MQKKNWNRHVQFAKPTFRAQKDPEIIYENHMQQAG